MRIGKLKRKRYTPEAFKREFKIGDHVCGYATGKTVQITAIGETRFLAKHPTMGEGVNTMEHYQGWVKVNVEPFTALMQEFQYTPRKEEGEY